MSKRPPGELDADGQGPSLAKQPRLEGPASANGYTQAGAQQAEQDEWKPIPKEAMPIRYRDGRPLKQLSEYYKQDKDLVEVTIPAECMTGTNKQVKSRQLWGDKVYTDDSDLVAVLMHLGYFATNNASVSPQVLTFHALLKLLPPRDQYTSCFRNAVRSRAWFAKVDGCSYEVERCWLLTKSQQHVELLPGTEDSAITHPTFQPSSYDRQMNTRSTAGSGRAKPVSEVTVLYNLCNEPWLKYSLGAIADRSLKSKHWTSVRLREEVLYMETTRQRFEVARVAGANTEEGEGQEDLYRLSRCKTPLPLSVMKKFGSPLPADQVEVLETGLHWDDFQWGNQGVLVRGVEYKIVRINFFPVTPPAAH